VFPDRARRPSTLPFELDLSYSLIIAPLNALGLVWDIKTYDAKWNKCA